MVNLKPSQWQPSILRSSTIKYIYVIFQGVNNVFKPLNYMPYVKQEAMRTLQQIYEWKPTRKSTLNHDLHGFFDGYLKTRFGFDITV